MANTITYYDFNDLNYSSYFLSGFHQNQDRFQYTFTVTKKIPEIVLKFEEQKKWISVLFSVSLFKASFEGDEFFFCIDTRDSNDTDLDDGIGYHLPLLESVKYYFKVNYNQENINNNPLLSKYKEKILPALPFFAVKSQKFLSYLPRLLPNRSVQWTFSDSIRRLKMLRSMLPIEEIIDMRDEKKQHDIFFVVTYYHEDVHIPDNEYRYQIMEELKKHPDIKSLVGFISYKKIPEKKYADLQVDAYPLKEYLRCLARSRVSIYVRGLHNCLSFKFNQLLLLGLPVIGQTLSNNQENLMENKYFNEQFAFDDPKEIVDEIARLLTNPERQKMIGESNKQVFEDKFTPKHVVEDVLKQMAIRT